MNESRTTALKIRRRGRARATVEPAPPSAPQAAVWASRLLGLGVLLLLVGALAFGVWRLRAARRQSMAHRRAAA